MNGIENGWPISWLFRPEAINPPTISSAGLMRRASQPNSSQSVGLSELHVEPHLMVVDMAAGHEALPYCGKPSSYPTGHNCQIAKKTGEAVLRDIRSGYALTTLTQNRSLILIVARLSPCLSRCMPDPRSGKCPRRRLITPSQSPVLAMTITGNPFDTGGHPKERVAANIPDTGAGSAPMVPIPLRMKAKKSNIDSRSNFT